MKTVGIIGGSGFIGSHITKKFLNEGFRVRVSATDISKTEKYHHLKTLPYSENLEVVLLKVENKTQLTEFVKGCDFVIHGGTPFQLDFQDAKAELFDPTIIGTENFLNVINSTSGIKKVVFIASIAAFNTNFPLPPEGHDGSKPFDEKSDRFTSTESHPYAQAKFIANRTVEQFIEGHPNLPYEISTVSPVMVMGKSLSQREDSTSTGMQFLIKNHIAPNDFVQNMYDTDMELAIVDVEDVADAIYLATTTSGLHGKNYLLVSETYKVSDVRSMLNGLNPRHHGKKIYQNKLANTELRAHFKPVSETLASYAN